ncbi:hypothetical protein KMZ68_25685 [Bradyrhizobium sediminis]|uniref:Uncharacterized protein n=1 Tax=Bradyrhizobium sediminis TaxID=2840469 RepID=A0A975NPE9_9BRAD|nr:hypothetical protein [Bradyrhizobium sediminis]QWG18281.1 hypothetical protein KMZ68_25685 [Bradyrhizobium sediminis]
MRKTILLGALITLFGAGALAQAKDITEIGSTSEATRSAGEHAHERHHESRRDHHGARRGHHDEARERHDERRDHDRRH